MAKYIVLANWTDKGMADIKDSPERVNSVRKVAASMGCELQQFYMTVWAYDMVVIIEAEDDTAMAKLALTIGRAGNVRTTTMKAFGEAAFRDIIAEL